MAASLSGLTLWMRRALVQLAAQMRERGVVTILYSGRRTAAEQRRLLAIGNTRIAVSKHNSGRAADLILDPPGRNNENYRIAGEYWTRMGGIWGGNFKDPELAKVEFQHYEDGSPQPKQPRRLS
jgi:hypothetical protein